VPSPPSGGGGGIVPDTSSAVFPNVSAPFVAAPVKNVCPSKVSRKLLEMYNKPCWLQDQTTCVTHDRLENSRPKDSRGYGDALCEATKPDQVGAGGVDTVEPVYRHVDPACVIVPSAPNLCDGRRLW
jgi:hypothetical protein